MQVKFAENSDVLERTVSGQAMYAAYSGNCIYPWLCSTALVNKRQFFLIQTNTEQGKAKMATKSAKLPL